MITLILLCLFIIGAKYFIGAFIWLIRAACSSLWWIFCFFFFLYVAAALLGI